LTTLREGSDIEGDGASADDHPLAGIRLGEKCVAYAQHALDRCWWLAADLDSPQRCWPL
jgi:hypothetical protein